MKTFQQFREEATDQWWVVKSGTKQVLGGPYGSKEQADSEVARLSKVGQSVSSRRGTYVGNHLLESIPLREARDIFSANKDKMIGGIAAGAS